MSTRARTLTIALALAGALARPLLAQTGAQDPVPRELVVALLDYGPGAQNLDLRVGRAPDGLPAELIPAGARIVGSVNRFEGTLTVVVVPTHPDSALIGLGNRLVGAGWQRPQPFMPRPAGTGGGFVVGASGSGSPDFPDMYCRGRDYAALFASYRRAGETLVKINYTPNAMSSPCRRDETGRVYRGMMDDAPVPTLYAPDGARSTGGGRSSGSDGVHLTTHLITSLDATKLAAHYGTQMIAAGWTLVNEGAGDWFAARLFRKEDKGVAWYGGLIVTARPDGYDRDVVLQLTRK
jgi:hypothetical protein